MERSLTNLPVDLLLQQLTYLPFDDVVKICTSNRTLYSYCSDSKYNIRWKALINSTFGSVYNYEDKLKKIWTKLNIPETTYNYVVYTKFIDLLDPLTQLMIYYLQNDTKSFYYKKFNGKRFNNLQRFLAMFLLNKPEEMEKYKSVYIDTKPYYLLLQGKTPSIDDLNTMLIQMAVNGNMRGVKYMLEKGADIRSHDNDKVLKEASREGHLDVVKYLVERGADIHAWNDDPLIVASGGGHLDMVKYLVEQGADIHAQNDDAIRFAEKRGHMDIVKYLQEHI